MSFAPGRRRTTFAGLAVLLTFALVACSSDDSARPTSTATSPSAPVLQPGKPGEANSSLSGTQAVPGKKAEPAPADVTFMQDMIVHHAQAITMVDIALPGLTDSQARSLARRIKAEQGPEIRVMKTWLEKHHKAVPPQATNTRMKADGHHGMMPGMATQQQLIDLQGAKGPAKDRQFLTLMIRHHQGALTMVGTRGRSGTDDDAERMANDIGSVQTSQITRMKSIRSGLPQ
ncbi:DUF305 domain-containing protein [Luteipulveratus mongoliensis]|uniref:DUF305 domain-containing protein n=1 Tax=Luteipulveratus mongoliensis TaxID=571913 RepID=A0A0K1JQ75_9MICO|nr:DUF305 domain-containing protein [Luteipulveratus mongoliensis]AKU18700.1 hypothetical protein VV02_06715 [Luteipulveratus mongoliensis]